MTFDRACLIKKMAKDLLADYGHEAYEKFCETNPKARWDEYEQMRVKRAELERLMYQPIIDHLAALVENIVIPRLCGPWGRT